MVDGLALDGGGAKGGDGGAMEGRQAEGVAVAVGGAVDGGVASGIGGVGEVGHGKGEVVEEGGGEVGGGDLAEGVGEVGGDKVVGAGLRGGDVESGVVGGRGGCKEGHPCVVVGDCEESALRATEAGGVEGSEGGERKELSEGGIMYQYCVC